MTTQNKLVGKEKNLQNDIREIMRKINHLLSYNLDVEQIKCVVRANKELEKLEA